MLMLSKNLSLIIRLLSAILVLTFLSQDIAWAYPQTLSANLSSNNKLAVSPFSSQIDSPALALAKFMQLEIEKPARSLARNFTVAAAFASLTKFKADKPEWFKETNVTYEARRLDGSVIDDDREYNSAVEILIKISSDRTLRYYDSTVDGLRERHPGNVLQEVSFNSRVGKQLLDTDALSSRKLDQSGPASKKQFIKTSILQDITLMREVAILSLCAFALLCGWELNWIYLGIDLYILKFIVRWNFKIDRPAAIGLLSGLSPLLMGFKSEAESGFIYSMIPLAILIFVWLSIIVTTIPISDARSDENNSTPARSSNDYDVPGVIAELDRLVHSAIDRGSWKEATGLLDKEEDLITKYDKRFAALAVRGYQNLAILLLKKELDEIERRGRTGLISSPSLVEDLAIFKERAKTALARAYRIFLDNPKAINMKHEARYIVDGYDFLAYAFVNQAIYIQEAAAASNRIEDEDMKSHAHYLNEAEAAIGISYSIVKERLAQGAISHKEGKVCLSKDFARVCCNLALNLISHSNIKYEDIVKGNLGRAMKLLMMGWDIVNRDNDFANGEKGERLAMINAFISLFSLHDEESVLNEAIECFKPFAEARPGDVIASIVLAFLYLKTGKLPQADSQARAIVESKDIEHGLCDIARSIIKAKEAMEAMDVAGTIEDLNNIRASADGAISNADIKSIIDGYYKDKIKKLPAPHKKHGFEDATPEDWVAVRAIVPDCDNKSHILTDAEELALAKLMDPDPRGQCRKNPAARDIFISLNTGLPGYMFNEFCEENGISPQSAMAGELYSNAMSILPSLVDSFDWRKGNKFSTYAWKSIGRKLARCVELVKNKEKHVKQPGAKSSRYESTDSRLSRMAEDAAPQAIDLSEREELVDYIDGIFGDRKLLDLDTLAHVLYIFKFEDSADSVRNFVKEAVRSVSRDPDKDVRMMMLRCEIDTLEKVANDMGISLERVRQRENRILLALNNINFLPILKDKCDKNAEGIIIEGVKENKVIGSKSGGSVVLSLRRDEHSFTVTYPTRFRHLKKSLKNNTAPDTQPVSIDKTKEELIEEALAKPYLGEKLYWLRLVAGLTQKELGKRAGVWQPVISMIENELKIGNSTGPVKRLINGLAAILGKNADYLSERLFSRSQPDSSDQFNPANGGMDPKAINDKIFDKLDQRPDLATDPEKLLASLGKSVLGETMSDDEKLFYVREAITEWMLSGFTPEEGEQAPTINKSIFGTATCWDWNKVFEIVPPKDYYRKGYVLSRGIEEMLAREMDSREEGRIYRNGAAWEALVYLNQRLPHKIFDSIVRHGRISRRSDVCHEMFSDAYLALSYAAKYFDWRKGRRFSTYAGRAIKRSFIETLKSYADSNHGRIQPGKKMYETKSVDEFLSSVADLAHPKPVGTVADITLCSLLATIFADKGSVDIEMLYRIYDLLKFDRAVEEFIMSRINCDVSGLPELDKKIILGRLKDETLKELETKTGLTYERVRQRQNNVLSRLNEQGFFYDLLDFCMERAEGITMEYPPDDSDEEITILLCRGEEEFEVKFPKRSDKTGKRRNGLRFSNSRRTMPQLALKYIIGGVISGWTLSAMPLYLNMGIDGIALASMMSFAIFLPGWIVHEIGHLIGGDFGKSNIKDMRAGPLASLLLLASTGLTTSILLSFYPEIFGQISHILLAAIGNYSIHIFADSRALFNINSEVILKEDAKPQSTAGELSAFTDATSLPPDLIEMLRSRRKEEAGALEKLKEQGKKGSQFGKASGGISPETSDAVIFEKLRENPELARDAQKLVASLGASVLEVPESDGGMASALAFTEGAIKRWRAFARTSEEYAITRSQRSGFITTVETAYRNALYDLLYVEFEKYTQRLNGENISTLATIIANALARLDEKSILNIAKSGFITKGESEFILSRKAFDVSNLTNNVIAALNGYKGSAVTDEDRKKLISHFITIKEIKLLEAIFVEVPPSVVLYACIHNPKDPRAFLNNLIETKDAIMKEEEFRGLPEYAISCACTGHPKDPRAFLRNVIKAKSAIMANPAFARASEARVFYACVHESKDPEKFLRAELELDESGEPPRESNPQAIAPGNSMEPDGVAELIEAEHKLAVSSGADTKAMLQGAKVLLSETLFDPADADHLNTVLGDNSLVRIVPLEDIVRASTNVKTTKENLACVISKTDYKSWNDSNKRQNKATMLILNDDLRDENYIYLEGIIGLAGAMMRRDMGHINAFLSLLFDKIGDMSTEELIKTILEDPEKFSDYLKLKPIEKVKPENLLNEYKLTVENSLAAA